MKITSQDLTMIRSEITAHKTRLQYILKEARELRHKIEELEEEYEIKENCYLFGEREES